MQKKKLLLIEDDLLEARAIQKRLEEAGFDVALALDGYEGLNKVKDGCDGVVLDIGLPGMDGWQVLQKLKSDHQTSSTPVVVCTVLDGDDHRARARELGAAGYVNKFKDDVIGEILKILEFA